MIVLRDEERERGKEDEWEGWIEGGGMEGERGAKAITLLVKYLPSEQEDLFFL